MEQTFHESNSLENLNDIGILVITTRPHFKAAVALLCLSFSLRHEEEL